MESSRIWLIWIGLTALLLLLLRLLLAAELLADPGCSSKLKAECVDWCASLLAELASPARGMLSGCAAPVLSKLVCSVRSALVPDHVFWWLVEPPLFRASLGLRNAAPVPGERRPAEPGVDGLCCP
jgi:hypothetical protein